MTPRGPGLVDEEKPPSVTADDLAPSEGGLNPNMFNQPAPPGFKMEPGPASVFRSLPAYKCPNCSWSTTREALVDRHKAVCDSERKRFADEEAKRGLSADEVRKVVVDTVKPMLEAFAGELRQALRDALPPPAEKPRSKKPNGSSPARKGAPRGV